MTKKEFDKWLKKKQLTKENFFLLMHEIGCPIFINCKTDIECYECWKKYFEKRYLWDV